jgi:membrane fusion protein, multidrug efflux system
VQHGPDGLYVYQMRPDHRVVQTAIEISAQDTGHNGLEVVTAGLTKNAIVVVSGQYRLVPGARVTIISAPSPPNSASTPAG